MTQINQNINNIYTNPELARQYQTKQNQNQPVRIPNYYYVPEKNLTLKESLEENPATSLAYDMLLKPFIEHPIAVLGSWLGISVGLDAYTKACGGEYKKSLAYKVANFGDKIQNSSLIQNKPVQSLLDLFKSAGNKINKLTEKSAILRAMKHTPTMPELEMVKSQMFNQKQEIEQEFLRITDTLKLNTEGNPKLKDLGISKKEIKMLKEVFNVNKISDIPELAATNQIQLSRLGKSKDQIEAIQRLADSGEKVKEEVLKAMGMPKDKLKLIKEDTTGKYIKDVEEACRKVGNKVRIGAGHYKWMGLLTKLFERSFGCDGISNKLRSMISDNHTGTGKFLSRAMQTIHRGLTFGNGKLGALIFIAPILVETAMNVVKADKDQKVGTAASGFVNNISWVFTFPLALKMMHSLGGIKYAGMTKAQVEECRKLISDFNQKTFANKDKYNEALKELQKQLKERQIVEGQNKLVRGLRKFMGGMTMDLGKPKSYRNGTFVGNTLRKCKQGLRNVAAVPGRFLIWGLLSMGLLDTLLSKGVKSIFGESYDAMKHDERKADRKNQEKFLREDLNKRLYEKQKIKQYGNQPQFVMNSQKTPNNISTKGINMYGNQSLYANTQNNLNNIKPQWKGFVDNNIDNYTYIPSQNSTIKQPIKDNKIDNYTYIPSQKNTIKLDNSDNKKQRTYIPSQEGAKFSKTYDNSGLQSALDRADRAETKAMQVLAGNFDGM